MTTPSNSKKHVTGQKWSKYPHKELLLRWARGELSHSQAIGQLLLWSEDTHEIATECNQTQFVFAREQRDQGQDQELLFQKIETLVEEQTALKVQFDEQITVLTERIRLLERR